MRLKNISAALVVAGLAGIPMVSTAASTIIVKNPVYLYTFNTAGKLDEAGSMADSWSGYWWVNSGGGMNLANGIGSTLQGDQPRSNLWEALYAKTNALDTDNGLHPQNLFRLVTRQTWGNSREEAYFKIDKDNLSSSPNRNASNGLLLMSRYVMGGQTLYYAGIRVDGTAVIKKKLNGVYTTLAQNTIFSGTWNVTKSPNLLPKNTWIGLRSEVTNNADGSVSIKLYMDQGKTGTWKLVAQAKDAANAITKAGYSGIRTDFMDVEFDDFRQTSL